MYLLRLIQVSTPAHSREQSSHTHPVHLRGNLLTAFNVLFSLSCFHVIKDKPMLDNITVYTVRGLLFVSGLLQYPFNIFGTFEVSVDYKQVWTLIYQVFNEPKEAFLSCYFTHTHCYLTYPHYKCSRQNNGISMV